MPAGRPTDYSEKLAFEFCLRVISGRSVASVCADLDMPSSTTVYRWQQEKPEFRDKLTYARDERTESYAERMVALADRAMTDMEIDHNRINSAVNAIDKAARLQQPKTRVEHTGRNGGPIQHEQKSDLSKLTDEQLANLDNILTIAGGSQDGNGKEGL
jgi:hypothetical protein